MNNQQFNRYAPPNISAAHHPTDRSNYLGEPQAVPAGNTKEWIGSAWHLFKLCPGKLIGAGLLFVAINISLGVIPYIGGLLQVAITMLEMTGFAFIAQQLEEGDFDFGQIFIGSQENIKALLILGAIGAVAARVSNLATTALIIGQMGDVSSVANLDIDEAQMMSAGFSVIALTIVFGTIYSAFAFPAPALIILENESPKRSMLLSWQGLSRNISGMILCSLIMILLFIGAMIPIMLGLLIVMPLLMLVPYVIYRVCSSKKRFKGYLSLSGSLFPFRTMLKLPIFLPNSEAQL